MGKRLKRCSTSTDVEAAEDHKAKRLKRCSTSTDIEAAEDHKGTKSLQKAERELQTDVNPKKLKKKSESKQIDVHALEPKKKHKKTKEMKKLRKSFEEMTETMKNLQEFFLSRADLPGISLKEMLLTKAPDTPSKEEEPIEKTEEELAETYECCFKTEDADGNNRYSVFVRGLDTSLPRDVLKSSLKKQFESVGCEVTRVFVPIECQTGVPLGFAFIDVDDEEKAFLARGYMGGRMLFVMLAKNQPECHQFPNFKGCRDCGTFKLQRRLKRFLADPRDKMCPSSEQ